MNLDTDVLVEILKLCRTEEMSELLKNDESLTNLLEGNLIKIQSDARVKRILDNHELISKIILIRQKVST